MVRANMYLRSEVKAEVAKRRK